MNEIYQFVIEAAPPSVDSEGGVMNTMFVRPHALQSLRQRYGIAGQQVGAAGGGDAGQVRRPGDERI